MTTRGSVAKRVREEKAAHPERFCVEPRCLWRRPAWEWTVPAALWRCSKHRGL
jgi:hypothetical protein